MVKYLVSPVFYTVVDGVDSIDVNTSSGGITTINLQPINISDLRKKFYVNDVSNNARIGKIILQSNGGNLINNSTTLCLEVDGISAEIEIADANRFIVNLSTDNNTPSPPATGDKNFVYNQSTPSHTWVINHNLNKYCSVSVVDSAKTEVIGEVKYIDVNTVVLKFVGMFSGQAYCN